MHYDLKRLCAHPLSCKHIIYKGNTMFIVSLTYTCDLSEIDEHLDAHVAFLKKEYELGNFLASGRKVPRTGGVILAKTTTLEELSSILDQDPFHKEGLARYDIQEFIPTMTATGLEGLMD